MKTKKVKFEFNIPHFKIVDDTLFSIKQAIAYLRWRINPPRCIITNKKLFTHNYDLRGPRIMFSKGVIDNGEYVPISAEGLLTQMTKYLDSCKYLKKVCNCCHREKPTISTIWKEDAEKLGIKYLDVRMGVNYWNGHNLCKDCIMENLQQCSPMISYLSYRNGKLIFKNKHGYFMTHDKLEKSNPRLW